MMPTVSERYQTLLNFYPEIFQLINDEKIARYLNTFKMIVRRGCNREETMATWRRV